jgi:hypothetical protein
MVFRILCLLLLFIITTSSHCKTDVEEPNPGAYQTTGVSKLGKPTLYTKNWQTQDSNFIKIFLQHYSFPNYYFKYSAASEVFSEQLKITFQNGNAARIELQVPGYPLSVKNGTSTQIPGYGLMLDPKDTLLYYFSTDSCGYYQKKASLYQLAYSCYPGAPNTENCYSSYFFPLRNDNGSLFLPVYSAIITCGSLPAGFCSSGRTDVKNVFDPSIITQLKANDTIVLQSKEVPLQKL